MNQNIPYVCVAYTVQCVVCAHHAQALHHNNSTTMNQPSTHAESTMHRRRYVLCTIVRM